MPLTLKIPTIFEAVDKISATAKRMKSSVVGFARGSEVALSRMERRVRSLTPSFKGLRQQIGGLGLLVGGAALVGALTGAIKTYADFEQANVNLTSVMGTTLKQNAPLIADAKRLGATTSKTATEVVGLQEAYARLGFVQKEILDVTEATINGSVAMNAELSDTANLTGAMIRSFDQFSSADAPEILDQMTVATQKSALNFEKLNTALPIVSGAANAAGIPFTQLLALLGKLSDAGIDASSSSTALRNIFLDSAKKGLSYEQILGKIVKEQDKLTAANDKFGKRGAVSAVILAKNIDATADLDNELRRAAAGQEKAGAASRAANKQLDTLNGSLTLLKSAYEGFILSIESGDGTLAVFVRDVVKVGTEILSLASGSAKAESELSNAQKRIRSIANTAIFFGKIIAGIVTLYVAANVALKIWRIGLIAFNVIQGVTTALAGGTAFALRGSAIAMQAFGVATKIVTGVQWLWNAAMAANPIGLIIIGIAALIAIIAVAINKYNEWGAALLFVMGPLGFIINLIQAFRRNWEMIKESFKSGGIIGGLKAIGATILDAVLMPLQQLLSLLASVPGLGFAKVAVDGIQKLRENIGVNVETDESGEKLINSQANSENARILREESIQKQRGTLTIENKTENEASLEGDFNPFEVSLSSTQNF